MCGIEPSNLAGELTGLKIGRDSIDWYQSEIDRFNRLSSEYAQDGTLPGPEQPEQAGNADELKVLVDFAKPVLQPERSD